MFDCILVFGVVFVGLKVIAGFEPSFASGLDEEEPLGRIAAVESGILLMLVVVVRELRVAQMAEHVTGGVTVALISSACITTSGLILFSAFPDIALNILWSLAFILVRLIFRISSLFISSTLSIANLTFTLLGSSTSDFNRSFRSGSALINNFSVNLTNFDGSTDLVLLISVASFFVVLWIITDAGWFKLVLDSLLVDFNIPFIRGNSSVFLELSVSRFFE